MTVTIKPVSKQEVHSLLEDSKVVNRVPKHLLKQLHNDGWKVVYDYSIEKVYKGYFIVIEFCIGDFCVSICSKKGHWLLEKKIPCPDFGIALLTAATFEMRIDKGEHWPGEDH